MLVYQRRAVHRREPRNHLDRVNQRLLPQLCVALGRLAAHQLGQLGVGRLGRVEHGRTIDSRHSSDP